MYIVCMCALWICAVLTGPEHIQEFIDSEGVTEAFRRAALTRPVFSKRKAQSNSINYCG